MRNSKPHLGLGSMLLWSGSKGVVLKNKPILRDKLALFRACRGSELFAQTVELSITTIETSIGTVGTPRHRFS